MKKQTKGILTNEYIQLKRQKLIIFSFRGKIKQHEIRIGQLETTDIFKEWRKLNKSVKTLGKHINNAHDKILTLIK